MLPAKISSEMSEVRRDIEACDQGRLRGGILITLATVLVVASGWPPGNGLEREIFLVMGALPLAALGSGLAAGALIGARAERRGSDQADERELELLRAQIAREASGEVLEAREPAVESRRRKRPRPLMENLGPLVTRKRSAVSFRSGYLRLR